MKRKKRTWQPFQVLTLAAILIILLISCKTCPEIVPEKIPLPAVDWPAFPDPVGNVERLPDGRIVMSLDYWLLISRYVIEVEAGIDTVEAYRGIVDGPSP